MVENVCGESSHVGGLNFACKVSDAVLSSLYKLFGTPTVDRRRYPFRSLAWGEI